MSYFLNSAVKLINQNGELMTYIVVSEGSYNVETGSTININTNYSVKMYKKHIRANQYNFPNLIGQDAAIFYLANSNLKFTPNIRDKITVDSKTYTIDSITEHSASGRIALYKILAVRG